ncbi:MAG TPA: hypothetical protein VIM75_20750 [Ohtaekwangia sp.]|uniref:hypothetical protein n=1 Tax=Ohtaekwangia sp. TaxID=2066019 RepID=UPI002F92C68E
MIRNRILLKSIAVFLLLETVFNTVAPTISWALTSGPTAPEATSFEPVDTTDMVNLLTGDLAYNIPLLEVPGPSGGYPLSLSYHAGIQPDGEASWVGNGWALNPGALNREISGVADDHFEVNTVTRFFWQGGERSTYEVGVTVGISGTVGATAGVSFANDTYRGFGTGAFIGAGVGLGGMVGVSARVGLSPYGDPYASAGAGVQVGGASAKGVNVNAGVAVNTNFKSISYSAGGGIGVQYSPGGLLGVTGASISSSKGKATSSLSFLDQARVNNNKAGNISTREESWVLPLPFVNLGYRYERYWIDETENVAISGALYNPTSVLSDFDKRGYDSYSLLDIEKSIADYPDPDKVLGGSFFNYDHYSLNAQGINGKIRPYSFKNLLFRQNRKAGDSYEVKQYPYSEGYRNEPFEFRFIGDFSNQYRYSGGRVLGRNSTPWEAEFEGEAITGESGNDGIVDGHLEGSRHIEWYTNNQIAGIDQSKKPFEEGFINCKAAGFTRPTSGSLGTQIGGFKVTNESGVTYHFALPVYAFDEYQYSENIDRKDGLKFNELKKTEPYAYTWFLTAITGPDYVDRGPSGAGDGLVNEYDWGYWVEFEYGKWTNNYKWRNPSTGFIRDTDSNFQNYARGSKEIYYLDAIKTKSHVALFVKFLREDAKGVATYNGGFIPKVEGYQNCAETPYSFPVSTLGLKEIILIDRASGDYSEDTFLQKKASGGTYFSKEYTCYMSTCRQCGREMCCTETRDFSRSGVVHNEANVLDETDNLNFTNGVLRKIQFVHDYSLQPETPNSLKNDYIYTTPPPSDENKYVLGGKLTLKEIAFAGKDGKIAMPNVLFKYDLDNPKRGNGTITSASGKYILYQDNSDLVTGDLIKFGSNNKDCYALISSKSGIQHELKILGKYSPVSGNASWEQTKNPPYNQDKYDMWGGYKSDFEELGNENLSRLTTEKSSRSIDVWSLRSVTSSVGSIMSFNYQSDEYRRPALTKNSLFTIKSMTYNAVSKSLKFEIYEEGLDLTEYREQLIGAEFKIQVARDYSPSDPYCSCECDGYVMNNFTPMGTYYEIKTGSISATNLFALTSNSFEIQDNTLFDDLYKQTNQRYADKPCRDRNNSIYKPTIIIQKADLIGGNVVLGAELKSYGGGLRTSEITLINPLNGNSFSTVYEYKDGITPYEPITFSKVNLNYDWRKDYHWTYQLDLIKDNKAAFENLLYTSFSQLLAISRELPPPGVIYKTVTVRERANDIQKLLPNYTEYEFQTFEEDNIGMSKLNEANSDIAPRQYDGITYEWKRSRDIVLRDLTASTGTLKRVTLFSEEGNKVNETINHFLHDGLTGDVAQRAEEYRNRLAPFNYQGVIQETLVDSRFAKQKDGSYDLLAVVSRKQSYPSIQTGQTTTNFKTGIQTSTSNLAFDFYGGQVIKTQTTDGYGNVYITESTPAYRQYSAMGLAASGGKNMLTQEAASYTYKVDPSQNNKKIGLVAASVQTWSDQLPVLEQGKLFSKDSKQSGIWRKASNFTFVGSDNISIPIDGLYPATSVTAFNAWNIDDLVPDGWQKTTAITLYDVNSHALEAQDVNNNFAATRMSPDQTRVIATAANANYLEFAYSGAEDQPSNTSLGNEVYQNGTVNTTTAHTGTTSLTASAGARGFTYYMQSPQTQSTYRVSVWSSQPQAAIKYRFDSGVETAALVTNKGKAGNWYLLEADIATNAISASKLELWCEAGASTTYFDDFRVKPVDAAMTSYVYNQWGEVSHILDNNNLYTEYRYDAMGRLTSTYKESFKAAYGNNGIVKTGDIDYNYGASNPYMLTVNASSVGARGYIYPSGNVSIVQGKDLRFEMRDNCQYNNLGAVLIDGKKIDIDKSSVTLADGTLVSIQSAGKIITFKNVQTAHTLRAEFGSNSVKGVVVCNGYTDGNGNTCYDGTYKYAYYDVCGNQGSWMYASRLSQIPSDLQSLASGNCCQYNNGTVSGCSCKPGSVGIE